MSHSFGRGRGGYLYLIEGHASVGGEELWGGDAAKIFEEPELAVTARESTELLMVDVPLRFTPVGIWSR